MHDKVLRVMSVVFLAALVTHAADHVRRGTDAVTTQVVWAGNVQFALAVGAAALVFRGHRFAPAIAIAVGFLSAIGFVAAHLLPHWSAFSDSFIGGRTGPEVAVFSWFTALFEIVADVLFACAGIVVLRRREFSASQHVGTKLRQGVA